MDESPSTATETLVVTSPKKMRYSGDSLQSRNLELLFFIVWKVVFEQIWAHDKQTEMHQRRVNTNHTDLSGLGDDDLRLLEKNHSAWSAQRWLYREVDGEWRLPGVWAEPRPGDNWHGKPLLVVARVRSFRCKGTTSFSSRVMTIPGQTTRIWVV